METISTQNVHRHMGVHRHYNTFELQNALSSKVAIKLFRLLIILLINQKQFPLPLIIGLLFSFLF